MNKKLFYLTFNDSPGGIFTSQVIDAIKLYQDQGIDASLIAFISLRGFIKQRKKIKTQLKESTVIPAFPKLKFWLINRWILSLLNIPKGSIIIARNVFAGNLALLSLKNKCRIVYDGRGAIAAEQREYEVYSGTGIEDNISSLEKKVVIDSDFRIAVTSKLIDYWTTEFNYTKGKEIVIPCSFSNAFLADRDETKILALRNEFNIAVSDLVLVYSGSIAGWQSIAHLKEIVEDALKQNPAIKIFFLAKEHEMINDLEKKYKGRVFRRFVSHKEVIHYLDLADYGILLREKSITNKVASPVKCAEYLARGLKVLISPQIGDYSELVIENDLGFLIENKIPALVKFEKNIQRSFAKENLSKTSNKTTSSYLSLLTE